MKTVQAIVVILAASKLIACNGTAPSEISEASPTASLALRAEGYALCPADVSTPFGWTGPDCEVALDEATGRFSFRLTEEHMLERLWQDMKPTESALTAFGTDAHSILSSFLPDGDSVLRENFTSTLVRSDEDGTDTVRAVVSKFMRELDGRLVVGNTGTVMYGHGGSILSIRYVFGRLGPVDNGAGYVNDAIIAESIEKVFARREVILPPDYLASDTPALVVDEVSFLGYNEGGDRLSSRIFYKGSELSGGTNL
jgi:hypothetical protein